MYRLSVFCLELSVPVISSQSPIKWIPAIHETFRQNDNVNDNLNITTLISACMVFSLYMVTHI